MAGPWKLIVMVVSSDLEGRRRIKNILGRWGLELICAATVKETGEVLVRQPIPLIFCEAELADGTYRDILSAVALSGSETRVVVIRQTNDGNAVEALRLGAFDVIPSSFEPTDLEWVVVHALRDLARDRNTQAARPTASRFPSPKHTA